MPQTIGIYSSQGDLLGRLRDACPEWTFAADGDERLHARIAIVDGEEPPAESKAVARIVIDAARERRPGELYVTREELLRDPGNTLGFAADLADAVLHAAQLELEASYLREIHELMTFVDAEAVSERITTTVLEITGL